MSAPHDKNGPVRFAPVGGQTLAALVLLLLLSAGTAQAQTEDEPEKHPEAVEANPPPPAKKEPGALRRCRSTVPRDEEILDEAQRRVHETVCGAALWFDGLFGEKGDVVAARESYGRVEVSHEYSEFYGNKTRVRFHARVQLPGLEKRLSAFIGRDDEDDFVRDRSEGQALRSRSRAGRPSDSDEFLAGLGFAAITTETFQSDFKVGVRNVTLPKVFVQNRFSYMPYSTETNRLYIRTTPFWNNRDGTGLTQGIDFDSVQGQDYLLRWANVATKTQETEGVDWRSAFILYQNLSGDSAMAYEIFIRGLTKADEPLAEYGLRTAYRRPLFRGRLVAELIAGYTWPREDPLLAREGSALAGIGLELPFGHHPD